MHKLKAQVMSIGTIPGWSVKTTQTFAPCKNFPLYYTLQYTTCSSLLALLNSIDIL